MKLFYSNGRLLEVRDVGPVLYQIKAGLIPIKPNGWWIEEDEPAKQRLLDLKELGHLGTPINTTGQS